MIRRCHSISLGLLLLAAGCGSEQMVGTWKSVQVDPPDSAKHFNLASITLNADGTYTATAHYEGQERQSSGKWTHDSDGLHLTTSDGKERHYKTQMGLLGRDMRVVSEAHGQTVTVKMEKES